MESVQVHVLWAKRNDWVPGQRLVNRPSPTPILWLMTEGAVEVKIDGQCWKAEADTLFLVPSYQRREIFTAQGARWLTLGWRAPTLYNTDALDALALPLKLSLTGERLRPIRDCFDHIVHQYSADGTCLLDSSFDSTHPRHREGAEGFIFRGLEQLLFGLFWQAVEAQYPASARAALGRELPAWLQTMLEAMRAEPQLPLEHFVSQTGWSTSHLRALFGEWMNVSPQQWLQRQRLENARLRLETSNQSIKSIAHAVGFSSVSHFGVLFKRHFGVSPALYRKEPHRGPT